MKRALEASPTPLVVYLKRDCHYCISLLAALQEGSIDYRIRWIDMSDSSSKSYLAALADASYDQSVSQLPAVVARQRMLPCNPPIEMIRDLLGESTLSRVGRRDGFGALSQRAEGDVPKGRLH